MAEGVNCIDCYLTPSSDIETLREILGLIHQLFSEIKGLNTRAPLQLSSILFSHDNSASQWASVDSIPCPTQDASNPSVITEKDDTMEINSTQEYIGDVQDSTLLDTKTASNSKLYHSCFPEDNLDSYSRITSLNAQYIKLSEKLLKQIRRGGNEMREDTANTDQASLDNRNSVETLRCQRDRLRKVT